MIKNETTYDVNHFSEVLAGLGLLAFMSEVDDTVEASWDAETMSLQLPEEFDWDALAETVRAQIAVPAFWNKDFSLGYSEMLSLRTMGAWGMIIGAFLSEDLENSAETQYGLLGETMVDWDKQPLTKKAFKDVVLSPPLVLRDIMFAELNRNTETRTKFLESKPNTTGKLGVVRTEWDTAVIRDAFDNNIESFIKAYWKTPVQQGSLKRAINQSIELQNELFDRTLPTKWNSALIKEKFVRNPHKFIDYTVNYLDETKWEDREYSKGAKTLTITYDETLLNAGIEQFEKAFQEINNLIGWGVKTFKEDAKKETVNNSIFMGGSSGRSEMNKKIAGTVSPDTLNSRPGTWLQPSAGNEMSMFTANLTNQKDQSTFVELELGGTLAIKAISTYFPLMSIGEDGKTELTTRMVVGGSRLTGDAGRSIRIPFPSEPVTSQQLDQLFDVYGESPRDTLRTYAQQIGKEEFVKLSHIGVFSNLKTDGQNSIWLHTHNEQTPSVAASILGKLAAAKELDINSAPCHVRLDGNELVGLNQKVLTVLDEVNNPDFRIWNPLPSVFKPENQTRGFNLGWKLAQRFQYEKFDRTALRLSDPKRFSEWLTQQAHNKVISGAVHAYQTPYNVMSELPVSEVQAGFAWGTCVKRTKGDNQATIKGDKHPMRADGLRTAKKINKLDHNDELVPLSTKQMLELLNTPSSNQPWQIAAAIILSTKSGK